MKNVYENFSSSEIYLQIYDGKIGVKQFEYWLNQRLQKAYNQGIIDADSPPDYDDVSKSQYD